MPFGTLLWGTEESHCFLFPCLQKHGWMCSRLYKTVKNSWVVRGLYLSSEDVWMPKLSSTDISSSGEIHPQGDVILVCAPLLPVDGLTPLLFRVGLLVQVTPDFPPSHSLS